MDANDMKMLGTNLAEVGTEPTNIVKNCNDKSSGSDDYSYKSAGVGTDCINRQAAIDALDVLCQEHRYKIPGKSETYSQYNEAWQDALDRAEGAIGNLPSAQPEPDEWCHDCKEYNSEKHCCPRWNRVIRETLRDAQPSIEPDVAAYQRGYEDGFREGRTRRELSEGQDEEMRAE